MDQSERPRFFEGQYLGADDLSAGLDYGRVQNARHTLAAHTWGIAIGLDLIERALPAGGVDVTIAPGISWDGYARAVVVLAPAKLSADKFANIQADTGPEGLLVKVWLRYDEAAIRGPAPGFENCRVDDQNERIAETFAIEVGEPAGGVHGTLSIAGRSVEASNARATFNPGAPKVHDESIPYQTFPEGKLPRWLIPIGYVRWQKLAGQPGRIIARNETGDPADSDLIRRFRRYICVIADTVYAADGVIRMRDRWSDPAKSHFAPPLVTIDPAKPSVNDLVWVEGNLRVMGDARVCGGRLEFRDQTGNDNAVSLALQRAETNARGGKDLQVVIGTDAPPTGKHALAIGAGKINATTGAFELTKSVVVRDNGNVGIGNETPQVSLQVKGELALDKVATGTAQLLPDGTTMIWSDGTWLRLNQNRDYSKPIKGVHTPGVFAPRSLNVGGANNWGDPGDGNAWFTGNVGIGTTTPAAPLDINGRILRNGQPFSNTGVRDHEGEVTAPWGDTKDWNIFVSPHSMGEEEPGSELDNAMLMLKCFAEEVPPNKWKITAHYKFRFHSAGGAGTGEWRPGKANYLLVPR
jgi:hypothetical protein